MNPSTFLPRYGPPRARHALTASAALLLILFAAGSAPAEEEADGEATEQGRYVGSAMCVECHDDKTDGLQKTQHGRRAFEKLSPLGCESCHGPGGKHVEDPSIEANQPRLDTLTVEQRSARCIQCHDSGAQFFWQGGRHASRGVTCTDCHSVHDYKSAHGQLKEEASSNTCFTCHADKRADSMRASHHPVREGKMSCMDCHNPHGTPDGGSMSAESVNEKCYECHMEKRGPFLWEHAPVRESCLTCHTPHGSNHAKLQKVSVPYLCQQCHSNTRHPGTLYDGQSLPGEARQSNRLFERSCLNCHAAIHGSNHPSGPYLGR